MPMFVLGGDDRLWLNSVAGFNTSDLPRDFARERDFRNYELAYCYLQSESIFPLY